MRVTRLGWGVKESLRAYVEGSGGTIDADAGAARTGDGGFAFEAEDGSDLVLGDGAPADGALSGTGRFRGRVAFKAHGGMLSVTLTDPWVEAAADGWVLSIAETATRRTPIARLGALEGGAMTAVTTLDGMMILGDHYPPGTALDPVRLA